ncbi:FKBP-type peptidyl-prolyl cis-trans isomerase [Flavisericum labens]|uniref:FKBP-type peptidyl-prolyl cis-trans isomerase n=1 Tax=Flavisericum labens TaxID=3377112 RepID=UPI00387B9915
MKHLLIAALSIFILASCSNDDDRTQVDYSAQNDADIQTYIEENDLNATKTESGLYYVIDEQGEGAQPTVNSDVNLAYKGYFLNGAVFDQSDAEGITFNLRQVIGGWTEGITYFNEGGSGTLLVPAHLGYGSYNYRSIPGGSVLIFDIELIAVN